MVEDFFKEFFKFKPFVKQTYFTRSLTPDKLYVDGVNGSDANDGQSRERPKKTIQAAIDIAYAWTTIHIAADTYVENVSIDTEKIFLLGDNKDTVIIAPASGRAVDVSTTGCLVSGVTAKIAASTDCLRFYGKYNNIEDCIIDAVSGFVVVGCYLHGSHCVVNGVETTSEINDGVSVSGDYNVVQNCTCDSGVKGILSNGNYAQIHDNLIMNAGTGIWVSGGTFNSVRHNNLFDNTVQAKDNGSDNNWYENFYNGHTNIDNGLGIATAPYTFTTGSDLRPVVKMSGWQGIILRNLVRKKTGKQTTQAATDANGTSWVDLKTLAPLTSDLELYRIKMTTAGTWAGTAKYRIIIGDDKVYPFAVEDDIDTGVAETFLSAINVQINETCKVQFRSDNAGDGAGDTVALNQLDYAEVL